MVLFQKKVKIIPNRKQYLLHNLLTYNGEIQKRIKLK